MPLIDHFHQPGKRQLPWPTIAQAWVVSLMGSLNRRLKDEGYRACLEVFAEDGMSYELVGGVLEGYPTTIPAVFPDRFEVLVHRPSESPSPIGVITLVAPSVKADRARREAFVRCCVAHLHRGAGLVLVDVVTSDSPNLHDSLMDVIAPQGVEREAVARTGVASYDPIQGRGLGSNAIEVRFHPASIGQPLPTVPFILGDRHALFLDLEDTYTAAIEAIGL